MTIDSLVDSNQAEDIDVEYKHPEADIEDVTKELVALANSGGGQLFLGIEEDDGEIVNLHDVKSASSREEAIQQSIRECVEPRLPVTTETEIYSGNNPEWSGKQILIISTQPGNRLYSFRESGSQIVFPCRLGSTLDYMSGDDFSHFLNAGIRPGRANSGETEVENDDAEVELPEESEVEELNFESNRTPPFRFSPGGGTPVTFKQTISFYRPYAIEGTNLFATRKEAEELLETIATHFEVYFEDGWFAISQRNASWYGRGVGNFLDSAFSISQRYNATPPNFNISKHHSEGIAFVVQTDFGLLILQSRNGIRDTDRLGEFSVNFITDGIAIDNRPLVQFLEDMDYQVYHSNKIDIKTKNIHFHERDVKIDALGFIESKHNSDYIGWVIAKNPFFENPDLLLQELNDSPKRAYEPLTKEEYIPCRIGDHHPKTEDHEYRLQNVWLHDLEPAHGQPHINANVWINW